MTSPDAPHSSQTSSPGLAGRLHRLSAAVAEGKVSPRDASIWTFAAGAVVLRLSRQEIAKRCGIGSRQVANIVRRVDTLLGADPDPLEIAVNPEPEAALLPLVAAEVQLSDHPYVQDAGNAVETLRLQIQRSPIPRGSAPSDATVRVRRHRMRRSIRERTELLRRDPDLSASMPWTVTPWKLPPSLNELVPPGQSRRGKSPDEAWVAQLTSDLNSSYARKDGRGLDLTKVTLWAFSRFPSSPFPELEAEAMAKITVIMRERGDAGSYWCFRRASFLVGDRHPTSLYITADAAITLRNHGYPAAADAILRDALARVSVLDLDKQTAALISSRLLSQLTFNHSRGSKGLPALDLAERFAERHLSHAEEIGEAMFIGEARRGLFDVEFARAVTRARRDRERFWLHTRAWEAFESADRATRADLESAIYHAQWRLQQMLLGLQLRHLDQIVESGAAFLAVLDRNPWIKLDHPGELALYRIYRAKALNAYPSLERFLDAGESGWSTT